MKQDDKKFFSLTLLALTDDTFQEVFNRVYEKEHTSPFEKAIFALGTHIANSWAGIALMFKFNDRPEMLEALGNPITCLIRVMYDALIQACYIVHEPESADAKGQDYLNYSHIEKYNCITKVFHGNSALSRRMAQSNRRAEMEPIFKAEFEKVKEKYTDSNGRIRNHWYSGNLYDLARKIGKVDEYRWYCTVSNSTVHGGPLSVIHGPQGPSRFEPVSVASALVLQMAKLLRDYCKIQLSKIANDVIDRFADDFVHFEPKKC